MSKLVILGLEDESGLWVADLEAGTVMAVAAPPDDPSRFGEVVTRGVRLATVAQTLEPLSSGVHDK